MNELVFRDQYRRFIAPYSKTQKEIMMQELLAELHRYQLKEVAFKKHETKY